MMLNAGVDNNYDENDDNDHDNIVNCHDNDDDNYDNDDDNDRVYQSPLSRPLADQPDEQVNVVHAEDHDEYHLGHYDDHGYDGQGGKYANR